MAERWEALRDNTELRLPPARQPALVERRPITADDFVYSLRRGLAPALASRSAYMAYDIVYAQAFNEGAVFVRNRTTGAFVADPASPAHRLVLPGDNGARAGVAIEDSRLR